MINMTTPIKAKLLTDEVVRKRILTDIELITHLSSNIIKNFKKYSNSRCLIQTHLHFIKLIIELLRK